MAKQDLALIAPCSAPAKRSRKKAPDAIFLPSGETPATPQREGRGTLVVGGNLVTFDAYDFVLTPDDVALLLKQDGTLTVGFISSHEDLDACRPRAAFAAPRPGSFGGWAIKVCDSVTVLGKVIRMRPVDG